MDRLHQWFATLTRPTRSDWIFALRTTSAGLIALLAAYALRLDHPHWAMMTVFIVAQPVAGMVLAKGFFRLAGTLVGAGAALVLVPVFTGHAWLFVAALALWIGLCSFVSSLLRNPEAYGAALAGYTATIIGLPAFGEPHLLHELALARCGEIVIGIACAGLTSRLILPQLASEAMGARLARCITDLASYAAGAFSDAEPAKLRALHRKLIADTQALGEMRAYARLETPSQSTRAQSVRRTIGHLLSALSAARMLHGHAAPQDANSTPVREALESAVDALAAADTLDDTAPYIARLDGIVALASAPPAGDGQGDPVGAASRFAVAAEFARSLKGALRGLDVLRRPPDAGKRARRQPALVIHRDVHAAWRNAVRATAATALMAAFWLETQWPGAAEIVIIVAVVSSLFAARPFPVKVAWGFFKGTLLALPVAFVVGQFVLPALPGFGWFMLFTVPILLPAALAMANPRLTGVATAFAINVLAFISPHQVMAYKPLEFLAGAASILVGILLAIGVFLTVLPSDPGATMERIARAMREDLARLCLHQRIARRPAFESLAYDRISQLMPLLPAAGRRGEALFGGSVAAVTVGLEILRLRKVRPEAAARAVPNFLDNLARDLLAQFPGNAWAATIERARRGALEIANAGTPEALEAAAAMRIIAAAIEDHPDFFRKQG